jgi:hypothetical protein
MDETDHALFPGFSAELVATALKDTPVVMVTGPGSSESRLCTRVLLQRGRSVSEYSALRAGIFQGIRVYRSDVVI